MNRIVPFCFALISLTATAQSQIPTYDPNSPGAIEFRAKRDAFNADARKLDTLELYNEIARLDSEKDSKRALLTPNQLVSSLMAFTDDDFRSMEYEKVLKQRGEGSDTEAAFFHGFHQWKTCLLYERQSSTGTAKIAASCWQHDVMPFLKRASAAGLPDATSNIGKLYEAGLGVTPSKYAAAEWYLKSAEQYNKRGYRDDALTNLEKSLGLVPDLPAALRLRKALLK